MLEGLWSAELGNGGRLANIGVLVIHPARLFGDFYEEGRLLGGDRHYAYRGAYSIQDLVFAGELRIVRYDVHEEDPRFGADPVTLHLEGRLEAGLERDVLTLDVTGATDVEGGRCKLRLTRRGGP
jgi:hypothetical protein